MKTSLLVVLVAFALGLVINAGGTSPTLATSSLAAPDGSNAGAMPAKNNIFLPLVNNGGAAGAGPSGKPTPSATPTQTAVGKPTLSATATAVPPPGDPVIVAAGDIACDPTNAAFHGGTGTSYACRQLAVSNLVLQVKPDAVLALGDTQYEVGSYSAFQQSYDASWGRVKAITRPVVGNHEYLTAGAGGYYTYFGAAAGDPHKGYYSYDLGAWHMVALNSQCSTVGGCGAGSPQETWLKADLAAHPAQCTLAYDHIPLWSSGGRANSGTYALVQDLYSARADLLLTGHDHIYERFAPQSYTGTADPVNGIREFIAGTGGADHTSIGAIAKNSEVRNDNTFGVLKLTLHATSYDWQFIPEPGGIFADSGTGVCHR